jgi:GWxTD domain-containing protein
VLDLEREEQALSALWLLAEADSLDPDPLRSAPFVEERGGAHPTELIVYYEVWSRRAVTSTLSSLIIDRRERERHRRGIERAWPAGVTRNLLRVPLRDLGSGEYLVELSLDGKEREGRRLRRERAAWRAPGEEGEVDEELARRRRARFSVRWSGEPSDPVDLDRAVEQLRYILPPKRFRDLQEAPMSRRKALFDEFWDSVDPDSSTEANELMAEYYRRAEFADRRFSWSRFAGWRSDRGRIYMINGDPDQVERGGGGMDEPAWERWSYENSGREYLFIDRQGFGDYQLALDQGL